MLWLAGGRKEPGGTPQTPPFGLQQAVPLAGLTRKLTSQPAAQHPTHGAIHCGQPFLLACGSSDVCGGLSVPPAAPAGSCEARHAHHQVVGERRQARVSRTRAGGITEKGRLQGGHGKRCAAPGPGTNPTRHVLTLEPEAGAHAQTGRRQARVRTTRARGVRVNGLAPSIGAAECAGPAPESNLCRTALTCRPVAHAARRVSGGGRGLGARAGAAAG